MLSQGIITERIKDIEVWQFAVLALLGLVAYQIYAISSIRVSFLEATWDWPAVSYCLDRWTCQLWACPQVSLVRGRQLSLGSPIPKHCLEKVSGRYACIDTIIRPCFVHAGIQYGKNGIPFKVSTPARWLVFITNPEVIREIKDSEEKLSFIEAAEEVCDRYSWRQWCSDIMVCSVYPSNTRWAKTSIYILIT